MLSREDCIALRDLSEEEKEIDAVAEHRHPPETIATELDCYLVHAPGGRRCVRRAIRDDIEAATARGDLARLSCSSAAR